MSVSLKLLHNKLAVCYKSLAVGYLQSRLLSFLYQTQYVICRKTETMVQGLVSNSISVFRCKKVTGLEGNPPAPN